MSRESRPFRFRVDLMYSVVFALVMVAAIGDVYNLNLAASQSLSDILIVPGKYLFEVFGPLAPIMFFASAMGMVLFNSRFESMKNYLKVSPLVLQLSRTTLQASPYALMGCVFSMTLTSCALGNSFTDKLSFFFGWLPHMAMISLGAYLMMRKAHEVNG